ncbi:Inositol-trisphosphate 3-kinase C [Sarcoptes scabiei]|nr:Inositol-trisphosphate 3-kinase C [Sarcoptes scabiei]
MNQFELERDNLDHKNSSINRRNMIKLTEFPPVTYSSSFVSYIIQTTTNAAAVAVGANENESTSLVCDSNSINNNEAEEEEEEEEENPSSSLIKMRWQQLAREAFNYSLNQRLKMQNGSNAKNKSKKTQEILLNDNMIFKQNIIDLIALNTSVNDDILPCKRYNNWVQLSGHEDSFALAGPGTIWKKHSPDSTEVDVYEALMNEPIAEMMPKFYRNVQYKGDNFIELEDLLYNFKDASIMDIKMGTRTFLESEVINTKARNDLYEKMIRIDPTKLTESEHHAKAVTKLRYMKLRENLSSSSNLGFRIEGFKVGNNVKHNKNLHMIKEKSDVQHILNTFFLGRRNVCQSILNRLRTLRLHFEKSPFFQNHEIIGSSLLIIYTPVNDKTGVWMIDFAKTLRVPDGIVVNHYDAWKPGNHEDGFLFGLNNLIAIMTNFT